MFTYLLERHCSLISADPEVVVQCWLNEVQDRLSAGLFSGAASGASSAPRAASQIVVGCRATRVRQRRVWADFWQSHYCWGGESSFEADTPLSWCFEAEPSLCWFRYLDSVSVSQRLRAPASSLTSVNSDTFTTGRWKASFADPGSLWRDLFNSPFEREVVVITTIN